MISLLRSGSDIHVSTLAFRLFFSKNLLRKFHEVCLPLWVKELSFELLRAPSSAEKRILIDPKVYRPPCLRKRLAGRNCGGGSHADGKKILERTAQETGGPPVRGCEKADRGTDLRSDRRRTMCALQVGLHADHVTATTRST